MWQSKKCPNLWLTKSEPRDAVRTSFTEILGGVCMRGIHADINPIAKWNADGSPGGSHLQCV